MKKYPIILLSTLFLISCNKQYEISKSECLDRLNNTIKIYKDYTNLKKDFIYINKTFNDKNEVTASFQFGYDSENKLLYEFTLEKNEKKWFYFEDKNLIVLTQVGESKTKSSEGEKEIVGENYFKKVFSDRLIENVNNIITLMDSTSLSEQKYFASSNKNYGLTLGISNSNYTLNFKNNLLDNYEYNEFNYGNGIIKKITTKIEYKKFTTQVNKEEFK